MTARSRRTRRTNLNSSVLALVAALAFVLGSADAAAGQQGPGVDLEIVDQTTFVAADGALVVDLTLDPEVVPEDHSLAVTVYGLLETEAEVDEPLSQPLNRLTPIGLDQVPSDQPGRYRLEVPVRSGAQFDDRNRVLLPNPGVYPISIELRSVDGPVASNRTHLVRLPQVTSEDGPVEAPLPVAIVLAVSPAEGLTLVDVERILIDHPTIPLTVILQHGVENQLRADPDLASRFVQALAGRPVLAVPPIDLDPSALAEVGQAELYAQAATNARAELAALGLAPADGVALLDAPLTDDGVEVIRELDIASVLDTGTGPSGNGRLTGDGGRLQVMRIDQELSRILGGGTDGPHRANRVLARLTMRGLENDAPVVLGGSALGVDPGPSIDAFLRALTQPGGPRPILLTDVAGGPPVRTAERAGQDLRPVADLLRSVQAKLVTYDGFFGGGGNSPDSYGQQVLSSLTRQRNPQDRARALELIDSRLDRDMSVIELHDGRPVTLAARSAPIPIIVENSAVGPRAVMLRFNSDKVVATEDGRLVTVQPGTSAIDVELETRSLGVSPLEVSVWTPDGETLLTNTRFEIRSTAVPGLGLLVSVGAVGLLGAWWFVDARRRRAGAGSER